MVLGKGSGIDPLIQFFDLNATWQPYRHEIVAAIHRVLDSGQMILSEEVLAFEREFRKYLGVGHAVGVGSGTAAITLTLRSLGIGLNDEVITVSNAGVPVVASIRAAGAMPVLVDVDPETMLMSHSDLESVLTEKTRAILPVHLYGQPVDLNGVLAFANLRGLRVIEDCSHAHGATYCGRKVGSFGDVGCFSFYPTKNLGAFGDGGICVTDDAAIADRLRAQRMYGYQDDGYAHEEGLNSRLDSIQAAILRVKLSHLDEAVAERRNLAAYYREALAGSGYLIQAPIDGSEHSYHLFVIQARDRTTTLESFQLAGIGVGLHYPLSVHEMAPYRFLDRIGELTVSERVCSSVISLPLYPGLPPHVQELVTDILVGSSGPD